MLQGCPEPADSTNPSADVKGGSCSEKAVLRAAEKGITCGTGTAVFPPDLICTRDQVVTFLYRYMAH